MSHKEPTCCIEYLKGLEPKESFQIKEAIESFKTKTDVTDIDVIVEEHDVYRKSLDFSKKTLRAHRYTIKFYFGDKGVRLPRNNGSYFTYNEVIATLENLVPLWNALKEYYSK